MDGGTEARAAHLQALKGAQLAKRGWHRVHACVVQVELLQAAAGQQMQHVVDSSQLRVRRVQRVPAAGVAQRRQEALRHRHARRRAAG